MKIRSFVAVAIIGVMFLLVLGIKAEAAELKVLSAFGMQSVLEDLGPKFERVTGHKLALAFATGGATVSRCARAACIEAARKKGDQPIETENVKVLGEGRYEMSVRNKGTLGSSVTTCTYDKNIGAAIR